MKIVYTNPITEIGGAERVLLQCISAVQQQLPNAEVIVLLPDHGPLAEAVIQRGARVEIVPWPSQIRSLGETRSRGRHVLNQVWSLLPLLMAFPAFLGFLARYRRTLYRLQPDIIHSHGLKTHFITAITKPATSRLIWHIHDFYSERPQLPKILKWLQPRCQLAIAISQAVRNDIQHVLQGLQVLCVRNRVHTQRFRPADSMRHHSVISDKVTIGLVATYANWKGQDVFIRAIAKLKDHRLPFQASIIGGPIYQTAGSQWSVDSLQKMIDDYQVSHLVQLIPFQHRVVEVYQSLDIVVHASTRPEPFGLTIAEAMACGAAVVVSWAGGAQELVRPGIDGLTHTPGDAEELAAAIQTLLENPKLREQLGRSARERMLQEFDESAYGSELLAAYRAMNCLPVT